MAIDERARHKLFQKLEEILDPEEAAILMEHLPPVGWADVATKHDLDLGLTQLEERMGLRMEALEARIRADVRGEINQLANRVTALVVTGLVGVGGLAFAAARLT